MQSRTMKVNGADVRWVEKGTGTPVVFIHGIPTSPDLWRRVMPLVTSGRCLALEMAGYGQSMELAKGNDISVSRQADRLLSWLEAMNIDRAVLVGHDLGGGVAQIAAVRQPSIVAGMLLTNCIAYDSWPIPSVKMMRAMGPLVRRLPHPLVKMMITPLFVRGHDDRAIASESLTIHWSKYAADRGGATLIDQMNALDVHDTLAVADELPKLRGIPARVIWGAADRFQKVKYGERLAHDLGATLQRIEGGKHFTPEDHPEVIARGVDELVKEALS